MPSDELRAACRKVADMIGANLLEELERLRAEVDGWRRREGTRDRLVRCGDFAVNALNLDDEHNSPAEVRQAIVDLKSHNRLLRSKLRAALAKLREGETNG